MGCILDGLPKYVSLLCLPNFDQTSVLQALSGCAPLQSLHCFTTRWKVSALPMSYASPTKTFSGIQQSVSNLESESPMSMHLASQLGMEIERQRASLPIKWPDAGPLESQVPDSALHPLHLGWCCFYMSSQRYSSTGHRFLFDCFLPCIEHSSRPSLWDCIASVRHIVPCQDTCM